VTGPATEKMLPDPLYPEISPAVHSPGRSHDKKHPGIGFLKVLSWLIIYTLQIEMSMVKI
jgi:hypothetical protein